MNDAGTEPGARTQAVSSLASLIHCHRSRSWSLAKDTVLWAAGKGDVSSRPSRERMARLQTQHYPRISDGAWALNIPASLSSDETPAFLCPGNSPPRRAPRPSLGRALHFLASMVFDGFSPTLSAAICCSLFSPHRVQFHGHTAPRGVKSRDKVDGGSQGLGAGLVFNEVPGLGRSSGDGDDGCTMCT